MSKDDDLPQSARYWPQDRIDRLRAMADGESPADPVERERHYSWFKEFARDAQAWMSPPDDRPDLLPLLNELTSFAHGLLAKVNELSSAITELKVAAVETPAYDQLKDAVVNEAADVGVRFNWLTDLPRSEPTAAESNEKLKADLAKLRQRERERPAAEGETKLVPPQRRRRSRDAPRLDALMAEIAEKYGQEVAVYVRQSFGNRRFNHTELTKKMERFVGFFKSGSTAASALADRLEIEPPTNSFVTWMKARSEVFTCKQHNHCAVWLGRYGLGRRKNRAPK